MKESKSLAQALENLRAGRATVESVLARLRKLPFEAVGDLKIDTHRALRCGFPEAIFCQGKTPAQAAAAARRMSELGIDVLATRASPEAYRAVRKAVPGAVYHERARIVTARASSAPKPLPGVAVVSAGGADLAVAEEARVTAEFFGNETLAIYDVGVAGLHRLLAHLSDLQRSRVVVAVAGMEGALASVVGGLVACPVIAVPTSVGYGAHFSGVAPLLAMMNSCAPNVSVVNIDNGFGAGYLAAMINRMGEETGDRRRKKRKGES